MNKKVSARFLFAIAIGFALAVSLENVAIGIGVATVFALGALAAK